MAKHITDFQKFISSENFMTCENKSILTDDFMADTFEQNWQKICDDCREKRLESYPDSIFIEKPYFDMPPLFGFSNTEKLESNLDVLIVSESVGNITHHYGLFKKGIPTQHILKDYYLNEKLTTYNQSIVRKILYFIESEGKSFYFTDLVKCYVDKKGNKNNFNIALETCSSNFLPIIISLTKPKIMLLFGNSAKMIVPRIVAKDELRLLQKDAIVKIMKSKHGESIQFDNYQLIYSEFPSAMNADRFVAGGDLEAILNILKRSFVVK